MSQFRFDAETHTYYLDDKVMPSITQVLPYDYPEDNGQMAKGTAVHRMCYLFNIGRSDSDILTDSELIPYLQDTLFWMYLEAFKKFRQEHELNGVYDIKSGSPHPCTALQLAGQHLLSTRGLPLREETVFEMPMYHPVYKFAGTPDIVAGVNQVYALYLKDTGKYTLVNHSKDLRKNTQIFLSFLTCHKWRKENNL